MVCKAYEHANDFDLRFHFRIYVLRPEPVMTPEKELECKIRYMNECNRYMLERKGK